VTLPRRSHQIKFPAIIGTDLLWVLVILAGFLFFVSLLPLPPNDYWWHLRIGEMIYTDHAIPAVNHFGWTVPEDQPFFYAAWLGEWLFYILHRVGGLSLVTFSRTLLAGIAFWLVALEARRRSHSWRIAALVLALACLMSTNNLSVRTQMFAWLPFILTYSVLSRYTAGQLNKNWLIILPLSMIFWVNLHGSFVLGLVLCSTFLLGGILSRILKQSTTLSWYQLAWLAIATALTGMATLGNPRFIGIIGYVSNLLANQPIQQLIEEWQSPTPHGLANMTFFASILLLLSSLAYTRLRLAITDLLLILAFLWLAWGGQRSVTWYGMITMPILAQIISEFPIHLPYLSVQKNWVNILITFLLFLPVIFAQPWFVQSLPLPDAYWSQVQNFPKIGFLLSRHTPVEAASVIQKHPGGNLFNELGYGSYLIWAVPEQNVFIDPRIELYPTDVWEDYIDISYGVRSIELLQKYEVDRVLLDLTLQPELSRILHYSSHWRMVYKDQISELWEIIK